jgi:23S rRNA (adenine2503-C2)-methyltransferase
MNEISKGTTVVHSLVGLSIAELTDFFASIHEPAFRAKQAFRWIHKNLASSVDEFTDFPKSLREQLSSVNLLSRPSVLKRNLSRDGTEKMLFELADGDSTRRVETVWLISGKRKTICASSQEGCSYDCAFCATGKLKFAGNLTTAQILLQIYEIIRLRKETPTNLVFMGMGEPLRNYENVMKAAHILHHPEGLNMSARHITISTSGVISGIERMMKENVPFNLAVSLNHTRPEGRRQIMNIEETNPLPRLLSALRQFSRRPGRSITLEYVMIPGVNMSRDDAHRLIEIALPLHARLNIIPLNTNFRGWHAPTDDEVVDFQEILYDAGVKVFNRGSAGKDIQGACGMLAQIQ